ncbi:SH3 domain-containing protein C23A1.17-like [Oryza glaberrima]|uniref:SH3 domain-containing protein C23A1.17-like n=1 Tax=Oryza glaberrima TaxID=4538 RepID=UPI00224C4148|nr:SH3 domain-containing protein C23A1.17-like [Oryza glaberrima]
MAPPIARNSRAIPGRLPWPPAVFPVAVPPSPMPGSLSSPIKWNPLSTFSSFSPLPRSPVAAPPLPTVLLLSPTPPAASSSPYHLARAPFGRAVASLGFATPSPSPASPSPLPKLAGSVSSSTSSGVATTPPPPAACAASQVRRLSSSPPSPAPRRHPLPRPGHGVARISPERRRPRRPLLPPRRRRLRQALPPCPCAGRRRDLHLRHRSGKVALGLASPSTEPRQCSSSSSSFLLAGSSSRGAASVVGIAAACSTPSSSTCSRCRLPSSPPRWPRSSSSLSSRRSRFRSLCRSSLRQADSVRHPRSSSEPLQPRRRLRPRLRVVKPRVGRVSPSSKDRCRSHPLTFRLRHSRPSPPRPFVVVVPSPRRVVITALNFG